MDGTAAGVVVAPSFDMTAYQQKARKLVSLVNQLRDAGAQIRLELPSVVVCGNQSAGESQLQEHLSPEL
jgi:hypothetical protein